MKWTVILTLNEGTHVYTAECLDLPGAISQGQGVEQAITHAREAIEGWLAMAVQYGDPIPVEGSKIYNLAELDDPPDYVVLVDVPIPQYAIIFLLNSPQNHDESRKKVTRITP